MIASFSLLYYNNIITQNFFGFCKERGGGWLSSSLNQKFQRMNCAHYPLVVVQIARHFHTHSHT